MNACSSMMLPRIFFLVAASSLSACVPYRVGTPAVAGRVTSATNAHPVAGASVSISGGGTAAQTQTDSAGNFSLPATKGRWHFVPLISDGYDDTPIGILRVEANGYRVFVRKDVGSPVLVPTRLGSLHRQGGLDQDWAAKMQPSEEDLQKLRVALQPET